MNLLEDIRVLIVDDSLTDLALNRALLESVGIKPSMITEALTITEAKKLLDIRPPDVCLIDYVLSDGYGIEVLQHIKLYNVKPKNIQTKIAAIIITGSGEEKIVAEFFRNGANDYLVKSEVIDTLIPSITRVVNARLSHIELQEKILFDSITGLLNRSSFFEYASEILEDHYKQQQLSSLIYIDLDGFKEINDTLGHSAGDQYLRAAAQRISRIGRSTDLIARIGGDEFIVLLRDISRCDLIVKIDEWMRGNETYFDEKLSGSCLRCSVGIAITDPKKIVSLEQLIVDADQAMYNAKKSGKNSYAFVGANRVKSQQSLESFSSSHNSHHMPPASVLNALLNEEFSLFFQPIRDLNTMEIQSLEVLIRWSNKPHELSITDVFSLFAEFDLYDRFHAWLVPILFDCIGLWQEEGCRIKFSINAPTSVKGCCSFVQYLEDEFKKQRLSPINAQLLIVEVNENLFNQHIYYFSNFLSQLNKMKISPCLDQFSKAETNMSTLAAQKFSSVKVRRCDFNEEYIHVLRLAGFLRICMECELIAVGVESKGELDQLQDIGVDKVQGHYLGEPKAACNHWQDFISQFE